MQKCQLMSRLVELEGSFTRAMQLAMMDSFIGVRFCSNTLRFRHQRLPNRTCKVTFTKNSNNMS
jgi:hypothetical protein